MGSIDLFYFICHYNIILQVTGFIHCNRKGGDGGGEGIRPEVELYNWVKQMTHLAILYADHGNR